MRLSGASRRLTNLGAMIGAIVAWQVIGLVAWYFVVMQGDEKRDLVWPALAYTLLLAGTTGIAMGLALQERRLTSLAVGAALFLLSDLILAFGLFGDGFEHQTECVWLTYGPGQMLIVFSTISAALVLASKRSLRAALVARRDTSACESCTASLQPPVDTALKKLSSGRTRTIRRRRTSRPE